MEVPRDSLIYRPASYGVIVKDKKILLVPARHGYTLPGGGVEEGESNEEALVREVREETGLSVSVGELLKSDEGYYISAYNRNAYHAIMYIYFCDDIKGEISTSNLMNTRNAIIIKQSGLIFQIRKKYSQRTHLVY